VKQQHRMNCVDRLHLLRAVDDVATQLFAERHGRLNRGPDNNTRCEKQRGEMSRDWMCSVVVPAAHDACDVSIFHAVAADLCLPAASLWVAIADNGCGSTGSSQECGVWRVARRGGVQGQTAGCNIRAMHLVHVFSCCFYGNLNLPSWWQSKVHVLSMIVVFWRTTQFSLKINSTCLVQLYHLNI